VTEALGEGCRGLYRIRCFAIFLLLFMSLVYTQSPVALNRPSRLIEGVAISETTLASTQNRIALVKPIFSATAYSQAFYSFYVKYASLPLGEYVTTDFELLNRTVVDGWGWSTRLNAWFGSSTARSLHLFLGETVTLLNEIDVDSGKLFHDGVRLYDVVILGFTEYVTEKEYLYFKQFVASGGTLIIMDACNFLAEVTYSNGYLSLTKGHGWEFNGTHAWKSVYHRWYQENTNWIGGNFWRYWTGRHYSGIRVNTTNGISQAIRTTVGENISTIYGGHEENLLQNLTETDIIGYWNFINPNDCPDKPVAAYMHRYGAGTVIHSGIMASDTILSDEFLSVFLAASIRFGLTGEIDEWTYPEPLLNSNDFVEITVIIKEKNGERASETISGLNYCEINFNATTDVLRDCYRCNLASVKGEIVDMEHQPQHGTVLEAQIVNDTCWRLDINTFLFANGNYRLNINATWEGVQHSIVISELIEVLYFNIQNSWWVLIIPWAVPLGAIICAAIIIVTYTKFNKTGS